MRLHVKFCVAALAAAVAAPAMAQGWTTVGAGRLDESGNGTVKIRWQPEFRNLMFCADEGPVKLDAATLRLRDGSSKVLKLKAAIKDMDCSKTLSVPKNLDIATIDLAYDPASLKGARTKVSLTAR
jgi:hypothetical protein